VNGERRVAVRAHHREFAVDPAHGEVLPYPGISVVYYVDGQQVAETWIPAGEQPSLSDDERLIAALRHAVLWNALAARSPQPDPRGAMTPLAT
jgi:hypothetical protein